MPMKSPADQLEYITRTVDVTLPEGELLRQLEREEPLRVKFGVDPTAPDVTLGWVVVLDLLRRFQEMGHTAVLIVGDFTAQVGDPSEKDSTRKRLTTDEVQGYVDSCLPTIRTVLLEDNLEVRYNSEWLAPMDMADVLELTAKVTISRLMDREDFSTRWKQNEPISMIELMYPLLQGTDSVAVHADVEIGGNDQLLNLLMGRDLQIRAGQKPQSVATVPLLVGTDGEKKMSQSLGNYISVRASADDMFGKTMSIPDHRMAQWYRLCLALPKTELEAITDAMESGSTHPAELKRSLARSIVDRFHGEGAGADAEAAFDRVFKEKQAPVDVQTFPLPSDDPVWLPGLLHSAGLVTSNGEARRLITQGAVKIDGTPLESETIDRDAVLGRTVSVGKRRFVRFIDA